LHSRVKIALTGLQIIAQFYCKLAVRAIQKVVVGQIPFVGTFVVSYLIVGQPDLSCKHHHFSKEGPGAGHAGIFFAANQENIAPVDDYTCPEIPKIFLNNFFEFSKPLHLFFTNLTPLQQVWSKI
jgi:hypothetical protein